MTSPSPFNRHIAHDLSLAAVALAREAFEAGLLVGEAGLDLSAIRHGARPMAEYEDVRLEETDKAFNAWLNADG